MPEKKEIERISWDETWMNIAIEISKRSVCVWFNVGAVFIRDKRLLTVGYNGPPRGVEHCNVVGCAKLDKQGNRLPAGSGLCRGCHAEMNAIVNAASNGISLSESTVYCTHSPCSNCAKHLINLPIKKFIYLEDYGDEETKKVAKIFKQHIYDEIEFYQMKK